MNGPKKQILIEKTATPFENSVVIGHWRKKKITAIKQQKSK
jgi:hypothetical protein